MITVTQSTDRKTLYLKSHFFYKDRLKMLPGALFDWDLKVWTVPTGSLPHLLSAFEGELFFKTPLWEIVGQPEPEKPAPALYYGEAALPDLNYPLFSYQEQGARFMVDRIQAYGWVLCCDVVGLGKTIESISALSWFIQNEDVKKVMIVCKKSIKFQWEEEIKKFAKWDMPVFVTGETPKKRQKAYDGLAESDCGVLIANYHNFLNDFEKIKKLDLDFCIIDEAHTIKSHTGKMNKLIGRVVRGKKTILLTGTPIMSKPTDIYGIVGMASKDYFGKYKDFENQYIVRAFTMYGYEIIGARNLDELNRRISEVMIRRTEKDVALDLPEISVFRVNVKSDATQIKIMEHINEKAEVITELKADCFENGELIPERQSEFFELLEKEKMFLAAKQFAADDPRCFAEKSDTDLNKELCDLIPKNYTMSAKSERTIDLVEEILSSERKVIIFTHFKTPALLLARDIEKKLKANVLLYTGDENDDVRKDTIDKFTNSDDHRVLIGNEACAEGLNLQCANYIINYESADTHAQKMQRIGRIRRAGSRFSNAYVYDMVSEGSYDEVKLKKLERDRELSESLIE